MTKKPNKIELAIQKDREETEYLIRDYGQRYTRNLEAEEIIIHLRYWREQKAMLEKRTHAKR